jgi:hypothetical protein
MIPNIVVRPLVEKSSLSEKNRFNMMVYVKEY